MAQVNEDGDTLDELRAKGWPPRSGDMFQRMTARRGGRRLMEFAKLLDDVAQVLLHPREGGRGERLLSFSELQPREAMLGTLWKVAIEVPPSALPGLRRVLDDFLRLYTGDRYALPGPPGRHRGRRPS